MNIPNYLKRWINIKKVFPVHLFDKSAPKHEVKLIKDVKKPPIKGMPHMLDLCKLELQGKHHSGIDDSRNIAACVIACLNEGFEFT
jgi:inhibitor of KinA sporulation pathway (predicted exonuclease)